LLDKLNNAVRVLSGHSSLPALVLRRFVLFIHTNFGISVTISNRASSSSFDLFRFASHRSLIQLRAYRCLIIALSHRPVFLLCSPVNECIPPFLPPPLTNSYLFPAASRPRRRRARENLEPRERERAESERDRGTNIRREVRASRGAGGGGVSLVHRRAVEA